MLVGVHFTPWIVIYLLDDVIRSLNNRSRNMKTKFARVFKVVLLEIMTVFKFQSIWFIFDNAQSLIVCNFD